MVRHKSRLFWGCRPKGLKKLPDLTKDLSRTGSTNSKNAELPFTEILKARPAKKFCAAMLPPAKKSISRKGHKNSLGKKYLTFVYKLLSLFAK